MIEYHPIIFGLGLGIILNDLYNYTLYTWFPVEINVDDITHIDSNGVYHIDVSALSSRECEFILNQIKIKIQVS